MKSFILLFTLCTCLVNGLPPPHPDVLAVRQEEDRLHPLQRSPALRNPHLLKILPLTSLLHEGEKLVFQRESHDVPREEIYKILTHAGLISRHAFPPLSRHNQISAIFPEDHFNLHETYFPSQDSLQYL